MEEIDIYDHEYLKSEDGISLIAEKINELMWALDDIKDDIERLQSKVDILWHNYNNKLI